MICLDTEAIREAATAAKSANENISQAVENLTSIAIHDDWVCSNKDKINEFILENANLIRKLQENTEAFLKALQFVSETFDETENNLIKKTAPVDDAIGAAISVSTSSAINSVVGAMHNTGKISLLTQIFGPNYMQTPEEYAQMGIMIKPANGLGSVAALHMDQEDRIIPFSRGLFKN